MFGQTELLDKDFVAVAVDSLDLPVGFLVCIPTLSTAIQRAHGRLSPFGMLQSPYFIPPTPLCEALFHAARRGVDVRVMLPPRGDRGEVTQWVSRSFFTEALEAGIKIALYQSGFLHAKTIVCDDEVGVVGSCNIDPRSYLLCEDIAAVIESHDYACRMS